MTTRHKDFRSVAANLLARAYAGGASDLKDEEWHTFTTPCRWGTQGVWSKNQRRSVNSSDVSKDGRLLAVRFFFGVIFFFFLVSSIG